MENASENQDLKVLIIDDDPMIPLALKAILEEENINTIICSRGLAGLEVLKTEEIAVIICDQSMPGMNGLEVLTEAQKIQPDAIRIVLTAYDDVETVLQLINIGQVSQYIRKPWDHNTLLHTVKTYLERYKLLRENKRLNDLTLRQHNELLQANENLQKELNLGTRIHQILLSGTVPQEQLGLSFTAQSIPSEMIDGDFYDFYQPANNIIDLVIGDVMGKGLPAALIGTAVKSQLMRFALPLSRTHLFNKEDLWHEHLLRAEEVVELAHSAITPQLIDLGFFVSLIYGRFDLTRQTFSYIDCGSTKPLHFQAKKQTITLLEGNNFPLGIMQNVKTFLPVHVSYDVDDLFIFYSDGITKARNPNGELFGIERLQKLIFEQGKDNGEELQKVILEAVRSFSGKNGFADDFTLIVVKIDSLKNPIESQLPQSAKFARDLSQIKAVRQFIKEVCSHAPGNVPLLTYKLQLAINEIFCNCVKHGEDTSSEQEILIQATYTKEALVIDITDKANAFDPSAIKHPSLSGDQDSGFGMYMIKELVDGISYKRTEAPESCNHIRIKKLYITNENAMDLSYTTHNDVMILSLDGEQLDAKEAQDFKEKAIDLITTASVDKVILDLNKLTFIDSSGLGAFLSLMRFLNARGGELKIIHMTKPIRAVFELVCMHKIFGIYASRDEAIHAFNQ